MRIMNRFTMATAIIAFFVIGATGCTKEEPVAPAPPPAPPAAPAKTAADAESQKVQMEDEAAAKRAL